MRDLTRKILKKKMLEYFNKRPKAKSAILKCEHGEEKFLWKVVKENKNYNIREIITKRSDFIMEKDDREKTIQRRLQQLQKVHPLAYATPNKIPDLEKQRQADKGKPKPPPPKVAPAPVPMGGLPSGTSKLKKAELPDEPTGVTSIDPPPSTDVPDSDGTKVVPPQAPAYSDKQLQAKDFSADVAHINQWNPANMDNDFMKALGKTKSFTQAAQQMPDQEFTRHFRNFGASSKSQLTPDVAKKARDYYAQHNPAVAQTKI